MNSLSNIWQHPRTSLAGLLIATLTITGVLSQQGVTFGHAGTGSIVSLVAALATAFLGLLARDPADPLHAPSAGSLIPVARKGTDSFVPPKSTRGSGL